MSFETQHISPDDRGQLLRHAEGQFLDFKSIEIQPGKLTRTLAAFANADGGELYVGITEKHGRLEWAGFINDEAANGHIQAASAIFPLGEYVRFNFLVSNTKKKTKVLRIEVDRTPDLKQACDGKYYVRKGAQNLPITSENDIYRLKLNKGILSYEEKLTGLDADEIYKSTILQKFLRCYVPSAMPDEFLRKQKLTSDGKITLAGVLLYDEEPQREIPKASIKIYRYNTSDESGARAHLDGQPLTIEGCAIDQIRYAVEKTAKITESIQVSRGGQLTSAEYPREAIHEIITNAIIHRDYSIPDNIHIRIFDNRIEVQSPGRLPGYVTVKNIRTERFSRNTRIVRLINKFPEPPNKDVGEGMNTAFEYMEKLRLKPPIISENENSVIITLRHEPLARPEILILDYLKREGEIGNKIAREITGIGSENKVKNIFKSMMGDQLIEIVPGKRGNKTAYRITEKGKTQDTSAVE